MSNVIIISETDRYETWGTRGFTDASKAHFYACQRSGYVTHGDNAVVGAIHNEGEVVVRMNYVNGGYANRWFPENLPVDED